MVDHRGEITDLDVDVLLGSIDKWRALLEESDAFLPFKTEGMDFLVVTEAGPVAVKVTVTWAHRGTGEVVRTELPVAVAYGALPDPLLWWYEVFVATQDEFFVSTTQTAVPRNVAEAFFDRYCGSKRSVPAGQHDFEAEGLDPDFADFHGKTGWVTAWGEA